MKIKVISGVFILMVILVVSIWYYYQQNQCFDGYGSNLYFDKKELLSKRDLSKIFYPKNVIAQVDIKCDVLTYRVNNLTVKKPDFDKFIADYNQKCGECLLISKIGGLYRGEIFTIDYKPIEKL